MEQTRLSVFDRLLGEESADFSIGKTQQYDIIVQNVRRDLQDLLNTRKTPLYTDDEVLENSLVNYGLDDFSDFNPESSTDRDRLKKLLTSIIRTYEPRLKQIKVKLLENKDKLDFKVRFHIDAILCIETIMMPVHFNSVMETTPPYINIKDAQYE